MATVLKPAPGYVLVRLGQRYSVATPNQRFDSETEGICVEGKSEWAGCKLFWEEFNASKRIEHEDGTYAFIKLEDIRGYETDETDKDAG